MNTRGQSLDYVYKNCLINMKYEDAFKKYIDRTLNIKIEKQNNIYSHYDFSYNDINKVGWLAEMETELLGGVGAGQGSSSASG